MRIWFKYFLNYVDDIKFLPKDKTFDDHKRSMQGYSSDKGYGSKEEFFKVYFYNGHPRHRHYHDYLKANLRKNDSILSIGSGRCINELILMEEIPDITCSDLDYVCREETLKIFPNQKFIKYDVAKVPAGCKFNCAMSLSMFYLFDENQLLKVFTNVSDSLDAGGTFILDPGGAEDNFLTRLIDEIICPLESMAISVLQTVIKGKKCVVTKKHQGYRSKDSEIIKIAAKAGFQLCEMKRCDYMTELRRSLFFEKLPDSFVRLLGRPVPYIRMFKFKKRADTSETKAVGQR